jgi:hypothetical protein
MTRILGYKLWILVLIGMALIPAGALGQAISGDRSAPFMTRRTQSFLTQPWLS